MSCCQKKSTGFLQEKTKLLLFNLNGIQNTFILRQSKNKIGFSLSTQESLQEKTFIPKWFNLYLSFIPMQTTQSSFLDWETFFRRAEIAFKITLVAKWKYMSGSKVSPLSARFPIAEDRNDFSLKDAWVKVFSQKMKQMFFTLRKLLEL